MKLRSQPYHNPFSQLLAWSCREAERKMAMVTSTSLGVVCAHQLSWSHHVDSISDTDALISRVRQIRPVNAAKLNCPLVCQVSSNHEQDRRPSSEFPESKRWTRCLTAALAAMVIGTGMAAEAGLNKYEAETRGEFGIGSAAQFGSADLRKTVHANENFRRANFTSADMRESDFSGSAFSGAYLEKAVAYKTNFTGADLSDTLMDRMVLNEANLTNAILVRSVLTRSDLGGAIIEGADFSDAVLDLPQKQALCRYASGTNPITGMSTRESLGCGNSRRNAYGTPSAPILSAPPTKLLDKDGFCDSSTGLCDATAK